MASWIYLFIAGAMECAWSAFMKLSDGFTHIGYAIAMVAGLIFSMVFLILATKELPISMAYPIWTGIGAVGSVLIGFLVFKEQVRPLTLFFVALLIVGIIGIKLTSSH